MKRDLREYARNTNIQLGIAAFLLLFVVGLGLIYLIYGPAAAGLGFMCLLGGVVPIVLILGILLGIDWILKRARPK
jgi:multisubunit Na+/H+ antiporter MnhB subunit